MNQWSFVLIALGTLSLLYLIVSLFLNMQSAPFPCFVAYMITYSDQLSTSTVQYKSWTVIIAKLLGFMATIC